MDRQRIDIIRPHRANALIILFLAPKTKESKQFQHQLRIQNKLKIADLKHESLKRKTHVSFRIVLAVIYGQNQSENGSD